MTRQELADILGIKDSYLRSRWADIVRSNEKVNIKLVKVGRGASADYGVSFFGKPIIWNKEDAKPWRIVR